MCLILKRQEFHEHRNSAVLIPHLPVQGCQECLLTHIPSLAAGMRVVTSAHLCWLFPNVHETSVHSHPSLAAVLLAQAVQKEGDLGQGSSKGQGDACLLLVLPVRCCQPAQ